MKLRRIFLAIAALFAVLAIGTSGVWAQNIYPRTTVVEEFTSATCGPCAAATPIMDAIFGVNKGCLVIKYHTPIPVAGDPWYALYPDGYTRFQYYRSSGFSAPAAYINGTTSINPTIGVGPMQTVIDNDNAKMSPISVKVTVVGTNIKVTVNSTIALNNHTLRVAVLGYHVSLPELQTELGNSWNGETEFSHAFLKFSPGIAGTSVIMGASTEYEFDLTYTKGAGRLWPANNDYVVAFVQNNATKEIMNAGTNLIEIGAGIALSGARYQKIDRGATATKEVTLTNNNTDPVTVDLSISNADAISQIGWSASLTPSSITVAGKSSAKATLNVTAPNRSWFSDVVVVATPVNATGASKANNATTGFLSSGTKIMGYLGLAGQTMTAEGLLNTTHANDIAFIPWNTDALAAFPMADYDVHVLLTDFGSRGNLSAINSGAIVSNLVSSGKRIWYGGAMELAVGFNANYNGQTGFESFKSFCRNVLGIETGGFQPRATQSGNAITPNPYEITGINADPISNAFTATLNQYGGSAWPFYTSATDVIKLNSGSKSVPFVYSDNDKTRHNGVRYEDATTGARVVYTTYGLELMRDNTKRYAHAQKIADYLLGAQVNAPVLSVSTQQLAFGMLEVNKTKEMNLTITNTGNADLTLTDYVISGMDRTAFDISEGAPGSSTITVGAGKTYTLKVGFAPTTVKGSFSASLTFQSNATSPSVALSGSSNAGTSVETEVVSETGAIGLRLNGQNPVVASSSVTVTGNQTVTLTLVDAAGRTVSTLFDGAVNGQHTVAIDAGNLTSGTYNVVATNGSERAILSVVVAR